MLNFPFLSTQIITPLLGAIVILATGMFSKCQKVQLSDRALMVLASIFALLTFVCATSMLAYFDASLDAMQFTEHHIWIKEYGIDYSLGVDSFSVYFVMLTAFLTLVCIIASWSYVKVRVREYLALFLLLEALTIGIFVSTDLVLFYLFFEAVLIPMYLIIGIWGGENRIYAAIKFFLYTMFGSVLMLVAILYVILDSGTSSITDLIYITPHYTSEVQKWLWVAFFIAFAIKVPMWPLHTWLPDAHVQAPTAGSVILAGVLLKIGGYGFVRFLLPMFPDASKSFADCVLIISIVAVIYTSLVALVQEDIKKLIAYSSVAHMGYVTAGIFTFNEQGIKGAIFQMISHGLVSAALFLCVGMLYERMHTKSIAAYKGIANSMPSFATWFMVFMLASIGLPMTSGFIGEFWILFATFKFSYTYGIVMTTGMVLGAAYMLWLYARVVFGDSNNLRKITDINIREKLLLIPIGCIIVILGVYPNIIMQGITCSGLSTCCLKSYKHNDNKSGHVVSDDFMPTTQQAQPLS